jgi:hypothetical protein
MDHDRAGALVNVSWWIARVQDTLAGAPHVWLEWEGIVEPSVWFEVIGLTADTPGA